MEQSISTIVANHTTSLLTSTMVLHSVSMTVNGLLLSTISKPRNSLVHLTFARFGMPLGREMLSNCPAIQLSLVGGGAIGKLSRWM